MTNPQLPTKNQQKKKRRSRKPLPLPPLLRRKCQPLSLLHQKKSKPNLKTIRNRLRKKIRKKRWSLKSPLLSPQRRKR